MGNPGIDWDDAEIEQLWAEAWSMYAAGDRWWPSTAEETLLSGNAEDYRHRSAIEERIEAGYMWDEPPDWKAGRKTATTIYTEMSADSFGFGGPLTNATLKSIGAAARRRWSDSSHSVTEKGVVKVRDTKGSLVKANGTGKNRGWVMPPLTRDAGMRMAQEQMEAELEKARHKASEGRRSGTSQTDKRKSARQDGKSPEGE